MLFGIFSYCSNKKQRGLYASFFGLENSRNGLHGKKYVPVFLAIFYITIFWKI